ncbi:MAG: thioredoxin family protein [Desulfobacterales bacterium]|jgi:hypothetical protein
MFTALEKKQIRKLNQQLSRHITLGRVDSQHASNERFKDFCENLTSLAPKIKITTVQTKTQTSPQIHIGNGLRYQAIPSGYELQPFLDALTALDLGSAKIAGPLKHRLNKNKLPAFLTIFISPQCTFCPRTVRELNALPITSENIHLTVIDGTLFPETVADHDIRSVPTILLEDRFRWTGSVAIEELVDAIVTRSPSALRPSSLESIIKEGGAGQLAAMMIEAEFLFPAFYDVLTHDKWPIRLGAMVVMEQIIDENPELSTEALDPLWQRFHQVASQVQGDILHVFGEIGDPRSVSWVESILSGNFDPEVKEAAKEAADKISKMNA